ncbi:MAG: hypothetical protein H6559_19160 [Lewinellaceae bacterium]|nr:hypothetical protein [Lewinellaceae bacterium]
MKIFVLQQVIMFRVDWAELFRPEEYDLILITSQRTPFRLKEQQEQYFKQIHFLPEMTPERLTSIIPSLTGTDNQLRIVTNDEHCILLAAQVRWALGIQGSYPENVLRFTDKLAMKDALKGSPVVLPKFTKLNRLHWGESQSNLINQLEDKLDYPMFAKPVNLGGSQLTFKIEERAQLRQWLKVNAHKADFEIDEFIEGTLYHCDSLVKDGEIIFFAPCRYAYPNYLFSKGKFCGSISITEDSAEYQELKKFNRLVLDLLRPENCATHLELFKRENGELVFLEIAARAPGAMICQKHEKETGVNPEKVHFELQIGLQPQLPPIPDRKVFCASGWFPKVEGRVTRIEQDIPIKSQYELSWEIQLNELLNQSDSLIQIAGSIILWNESFEELQSDFSFLSNYLPYKVSF